MHFDVARRTLAEGESPVIHMIAAQQGSRPVDVGSREETWLNVNPFVSSSNLPQQIPPSCGRADVARKQRPHQFATLQAAALPATNTSRMFPQSWRFSRCNLKCQVAQ
jgi:hypothetical protein